MEHYTDLAFRYIKMKKSRSILTALGVSVSVMLLYIILNLGWCYVLNERADIRERHDYEIVLFTESGEQIETISSDRLIKDMTVGEYYKYDYEAPIAYENAMYINTTNPYRMKNILAGFTGKYGVEGRLNDDLAVLYMQGPDGELMHVLILVYFLIAYIFAIFGVGIIRNSIQLTLFEQVKDFGNLRCIGSTRNQMQAVIFIQGAVLEIFGIVIGTVLGTFGSIIGGGLLGWRKSGFHLLPLVFVVLAFLFDLYFSMKENAKMVTGMSPVSAIRGEYRIFLEKKKPAIKDGHKLSKASREDKGKFKKTGLPGRIFSKIFGIEGEYAYKNLRRSPGRFYKVTMTMSFSVAAVIILSCGALMLMKYDKNIKHYYGYYPIYVSWPLDAATNWSDALSRVPFTKLNEEINDVDAVTDDKRILSDQVFVEDFNEDIEPHIADEYLEKSGDDMFRERFLKELEENRENGDYVGVSYGRSVLMHMESAYVTGYDEADLERCEDVLIAGTVDVSEDGIIAVENAYMEVYDLGEDGYLDPSNPIKQYVRVFESDIGDKIRFIDMAEYRNRLSEGISDDKTDEYNEARKEFDELYQDNEGQPMQWEEAIREREDELSKILSEYKAYVRNTQVDILEEMRKEGLYKTYTVEGIIKDNPNGRASWEGFPQFIVPASHFHNVAGREEDFFSGMMYHFEPFSLRQYEKVDWNGLHENMDGTITSDYDGYSMSEYPVWEYNKREMRNYIIGAFLFVMFIASMIMINYINNMSSNMYMRRKEFAQLRVIGVSKKGLYKMVILEGVAAAVISCVIGVLAGSGISFAIVTGVISKLYPVDYAFPWLPALLSVVISVMLLCGSVYVPLKHMGNDVAAELMTAGE